MRYFATSSCYSSDVTQNILQVYIFLQKRLQNSNERTFSIKRDPREHLSAFVCLLLVPSHPLGSRKGLQYIKDILFKSLDMCRDLKMRHLMLSSKVSLQQIVPCCFRLCFILLEKTIVTGITIVNRDAKEYLYTFSIFLCPILVVAYWYLCTQT